MSSSLEDIFFGLIWAIAGFALAMVIFLGATAPQPDTTKDREKCQKEGGVWTEVVHNRDLSYCTYFNNGG